MYSWVGNNRFDSRGLFYLVRQGYVHQGHFHRCSSQFSERSPSYNGDFTVDGRLAIRIPYRSKENYLIY